MIESGISRINHIKMEEWSWNTKLVSLLFILSRGKYWNGLISWYANTMPCISNIHTSFIKRSSRGRPQKRWSDLIRETTSDNSQKTGQKREILRREKCTKSPSGLMQIVAAVVEIEEDHQVFHV